MWDLMKGTDWGWWAAVVRFVDLCEYSDSQALLDKIRLSSEMW